MQWPAGIDNRCTHAANICSRMCAIGSFCSNAEFVRPYVDVVEERRQWGVKTVSPDVWSPGTSVVNTVVSVDSVKAWRMRHCVGFVCIQLIKNSYRGFYYSLLLFLMIFGMFR